MTPIIRTPRGHIDIDKNGKAELIWNPNFVQKWTARYTAAQRFVDSEVIRLCEPYTPLLTGTLIKTGILGSEIGSGLVMWIAPYAKKQYYSGRKPGSQTGQLRGPFWFARMKAVSGKEIIKGAKKLAGQG
jgi:hypothetical protein